MMIQVTFNQHSAVNEKITNRTRSSFSANRAYETYLSRTKNIKKNCFKIVDKHPQKSLGSALKSRVGRVIGNKQLFKA